MEHCIRDLKVCLSSGIVNESKSLDGVRMICQNFDSATNLHHG